MKSDTVKSTVKTTECRVSLLNYMENLKYGHEKNTEYTMIIFLKHICVQDKKANRLEHMLKWNCPYWEYNRRENKKDKKQPTDESY